MAATILVWYSHGKSLLNFGHVSLALTHRHGFNAKKLATISWFSNAMGDVKQIATGSSGLSNPLNYGSVNMFSSRNYAPESSGSVGGWQAGHPGEHGMAGQVLNEFTGYGAAGAWKIRQLEQQQQAMLDLAVKGKRSVNQVMMSREFVQLQQEINKLEAFYPKLKNVQSKNKNRWMSHYVQQYTNEKGNQAALNLLQTRVAPASVTITIPTMSDPGVHAGLNDLAMVGWWEEFMQAKKKYNWRKRNCATTVATALIVGGATYCVEPPRIGMFWAPKNLERWGGKLARKYEEHERRFATAKSDLIKLSQNKKLKLSGNYANIWSVREWKRQSDAGRWSRRYGTLTNIDKALDGYHKNVVGGHGNLATRNTELQNLVVIACLLNKILITRPKTSRKKAIAELGMQVLAKTDKLKHQQSPDLADEYRQYLSELKGTWSGGWQKDLEDYKNLDELISEEFPDATSRIGRGGKIDDPVSPEDLLVNLKNITEQLEGYEPDSRGILTENRHRIDSLQANDNINVNLNDDNFGNRRFSIESVDGDEIDELPIFDDGIHSDDEV